MVMVSDSAASSSTATTSTADASNVVTDATYSDYETRKAARNQVGVDDHPYISSSQSTPTEGASASTDKPSTEGETTVDEHYNKLFADSKYGSVDDLKYS